MSCDLIYDIHWGKRLRRKIVDLSLFHLVKQYIVKHQQAFRLLEGHSQCDLRREHKRGHGLVINTDRDQVVTCN